MAVYIDPSLPSIQYNGVIQGISSWNNSTANVFLYTVSSSSSAQIQVVSWSDGYNCAGTYGLTNDSVTNGHESFALVKLNVDNASCTLPKGSPWISTAAHELGHAMALDHNQWYPGSTYMLMNSCGSCQNTPNTPQSMDINIINSMYPPSPPSNTTTQKPATFRYADGHIQQFAREADGNIYVNAQASPGSSSWVGWAPLPSIYAESNPVVIADRNGHPVVAVRDSNNLIALNTEYSPTNNGLWVGWREIQGISAVGDLTAITSPNGMPQFFVRDASNLIEGNVQTTPSAGQPGDEGYWAGWGIIDNGITAAGDPQAVTDTNGKPILVVRDASSNIEVNTEYQAPSGHPGDNGLWIGWAVLPSITARGNPAVVKKTDGNPQVIVVDSNNHLDVNAEYTPSKGNAGDNGLWVGWGNLQANITAIGDPIAVVNPSGNPQVFVRDSNNYLEMNAATSYPVNTNGYWAGWGLLQYNITFAGDPSLATDSTGLLRIASFDPAGNIQVNPEYQAGGTGYWSGWTNIGTP